MSTGRLTVSNYNFSTPNYDLGEVQVKPLGKLIYSQLAKFKMIGYKPVISPTQMKDMADWN